jgi:hypothetical protein
MWSDAGHATPPSASGDFDEFRVTAGSNFRPKTEPLAPVMPTVIRLIGESLPLLDVLLPSHGA